jgi:hypothetical protein
MTRLARLVRMDRREVAWRAGAALRIAADRVRVAAVPPRWNRAHLPRVLTHEPGTVAAREAAARGDWLAAHVAIAETLASAPQRFVIAPGHRETVAARIRAEFPAAAREAALRADRICAGEYDLLGYRGLRFDVRSAPPGPPDLPGPPDPPHPPGLRRPDWHYDPVHDRRAPMAFWADVPFLSPECGDHKIIWELNRHQHWLALGRAFWLTGDHTYRARALDEFESWLAANPPLVGINWASMLELGFRSLSWIWAANFFAGQSAQDRSPWLVDLLVALDRQLHHIARNLSYYFSPNTHLLGEALALYVAGRSLPILAGADRYSSLGRRILIDEIQRQVLPDGGHCERSTHYHRYTLDFYLLALAVARMTGDEQARAPFEDAAARLSFAVRLLATDRGALPHIGDDDGGCTWPLAGRAVDDVRDSLAVASALTGHRELRVGPAPEEAFWLLSHPSLSESFDGARGWSLRGSIGSGALPDAGYYVSRTPGGDHLVVDAGPLGYQNGGHAHADALSVTLTVRGLPLLIDPGTGSYTVDAALRDRFRSTALHNTLTIDGVSQSTPAGPFHWSRAAAAKARRWCANAGFDYFEGSHDGYAPLEHRRHLFVLPGDLLIVADLIAGAAGPHQADAYWHVSPRWTVSVAGSRATFSGSGERLGLVAPIGELELLSAHPAGFGWQAPVYGRLERSATLRLTRSAETPFWLITVFGLSAANEIEDVQVLPVWSEAGALAHAVGVRVTRAGSIDYLLVADPKVEAATWRLVEFETDARALFCRVDRAGTLTRAALVDGTLMKGTGVAITMPAPAPDLHVDLRRPEARLSGHMTGVRLRIAGREIPIEHDRRGTPRNRLFGRSL